MTKGLYFCLGPRGFSFLLRFRALEFSGVEAVSRCTNMFIAEQTVAPHSNDSAPFYTKLAEYISS